MQRTPQGRFRAGTSGNPGGRPRRQPHQIEAAEFAAHQAVRILLELARDPRARWSQRRRAAVDLIHLAYGRQGVCPPAEQLLAVLIPAAPVPPAPPLGAVAASAPPQNRPAAGAGAGAPAPVSRAVAAARRVFIPPR